MARYVIEIPRWHPTPLNKLFTSHWGVAARLKKKDRQMVWAYVRQASVPTQERKRRVSITLILKPGQRGTDPDSPLKVILDSLVHADGLVNDSPKWVEIAPVQYERSPNWGSRILLEDM